MLVEVESFQAPKRGSSNEEYEDAMWVGPDGQAAGALKHRSLRISLADGASESLFANRWAQSLVTSFGTSREATRTKTGFVAAYRAACTAWLSELAAYVADREACGSPIQWYEEQGFERGAHATVLAADLCGRHGEHEPFWRGAAIGDSCLFQVRDGALHASFPLTEGSDFSYQPPLVASRGEEGNGVIGRHVRMHTGDLASGDSFYLATDAVAAWFLTFYEAGARPWKLLDSLDGGVAFADWVETRRRSGEMVNDDSTLVRVLVRSA